MLDPRVTLTMEDILRVEADALVIEDNGWLSAVRGLAATIDTIFPDLRAQRERAVREHGGAYPIGSALALRVSSERVRRGLVWAITFGSPSAADRAAERVRSTPLDVAAATRNALHQAAAIDARIVAMPALGTRLEHHVLPPTPKKLPRYVMAAAQLIGVQQALEELPSITEVLLCLSQRDYGIFQDVLGHGADRSRATEDNDD